MKRILFITPFGGNTGSEMMIYSLFQYLQKSEEQKFYLFSCQPGKLAKLEKTNKHVRYFNPDKNLILRGLQKLNSWTSNNAPIEQELLAFHKEIKADLWYINTLITPWAVELAVKNGINFTVHLHELPSLYQELSINQWNTLMNKSSSLVACSEAVKKCLIQAGYKNKIYLVNECVDLKAIQSANDRAPILDYLPHNAKIWVCSGMTTYRKGVDIVADILTFLPENYYILWIGRIFENGLHAYLKNRAVNELGNRLIFTGELSGPEYYGTLKKATGFLLTSREDPYPLVMLEAACVGLPIVSFNSGGVKEFIKPGMGTVFNQYSAENFANGILDIDSNSILIDTQKLIEEGQKHDVSIIKDIWLTELKELVN